MKKMGRGRPSTYTPEIGGEICRRMSEGETLRNICADKHMPHIATVWEWANLGKHPDFGELYARAQKVQADYYAAEIMEIADDGTNDYQQRMTRHGDEILVDHEHVKRSELRIKTRQWLVERLHRDKYAPSSTTRLTGADGGPVQMEHLLADISGAASSSPMARLQSDPSTALPSPGPGADPGPAGGEDGGGT